MDLSNLLSAFTNSENLNALSQSSGAKPEQVSSLIEKALPLLMKGMQENTQTENGANSLASALEQHAENNTNDLGSLLKNVDLNDGQKILGHIFGNQNTAVQQGLSRQTGLSSTQTGGLLAAIAPLLMSLLGGQKRQSNVSTGGLGGMLSSILGGAGGSLSDMLSSLLADKDGDGTPDILQKLKSLFGFGRK